MKKIRRFIAFGLWKLAASLINLARVIYVDPQVVTMRAARLVDNTTIKLDSQVESPFRTGDRIIVVKK